MRYWALLALAACGGDSGPVLENSAQSGARLKLRWLVAGDARAIAVEPNALWAFDTQLGVECTPIVWNDGMTYCTPGTVRGVHAGVVYADAACSQPLIGIDPAQCPVPTYASMSDTAGLARLMTIGPKSTATQYYDRAGADCIGPLQVSGLKSELHDPATTIDRSELVPMSLGEARGSGRVRWRYIETADGLDQPALLYDTELDTFCSVGFPYVANASTMVTCAPTMYPQPDMTTWAQLTRAPSSAARLSPIQLASSDTLLFEGGLFDRDSGGPCIPRETADGTLRCATNRVGGPLGLYVDAQCQTPIDLVPVKQGNTPPSLLVTGSGACYGPVVAVSTLGAQYPTNPFEKSGSVCLPFQRSMGEISVPYTFYRVGDPLSFDALGPPIELRVE